MGSKRKNIETGARFGRLTIVTIAPKVDCRKRLVCRCDCGQVTTKLSFHVTSGATQSCGCLERENRTRGAKYRHGESKYRLLESGIKRRAREYNIWGGMIGRCHNQKDRAFKWYGARGIVVCDRRRQSFEAFLQDMGRSPPGMSIDRIDNDRGYSPDNCRWATNEQQLANRRQPRRNTATGRFEASLEGV